MTATLAMLVLATGTLAPAVQAPAVQAPACPDHPPQDAVEVRLPTGAATVLPAYVRTDDVWIPVRWLLPRLGAAGAVLSTDPGLCVYAGEAYASLTRLAERTGRSYRYDAASVAVLVSGPAGEAGSAAGESPAPTSTPAAAPTWQAGLAPQAEILPLTGGGVLQAGLRTHHTAEGSTLLALRSSLSAALWGGQVTAVLPSVRLQPDAEHGSTGPVGGELLATYSRLFTSGPVRSLRAGADVAGVVAPVSVLGASISNRPRLTPSGFRFSPRLTYPAGTQYSLHVAGRQVWRGQPSDPDHPAIVVPPGLREVEIRATTPDGTTHVDRFHLATPAHHVAPGAIEYELRGGLCRQPSCDLAGAASFLVGLRPGLVAELAGEASSGPRGPSATPLFGVRAFGPTTGWNLLALASPSGFLDAELSYFGRGRIAGSSLWLRNRPGDEGTTRAVSGRLQLQRPPTAALPLWILSGTYSTTSDDGTAAWSTRVDVGAGHRGAYVEHQVRSNGGPSTNPGFHFTTILPVLPTHPLSVAAGLRQDQEHHGGDRLYAELAGSGRRRQAAITISYPLASGQLRVGISATVALARARAGMRAMLGHAPRATAEMDLDATLVRTRALSWSPVAPELAGGTGIRGRVYEDVDGDGRYGPADRPTPDIPIWVGATRLQTDRDGRYRTWGVSPYLPVRIALDSTATWGLQATPIAATHDLRPAPGGYNTVDFPLSRAREVVGRVAGWLGTELLPVPFTAHRRDHPAAIYTGTTFSDGALYLPAVPPGEYILTIDSRALALQGYSAEPLHFRVSGEDGPVELPSIPLTLHHAKQPVP